MSIFDGVPEEELPFNWGPGTENYPSGSGSKPQDASAVQSGPTEADWENSLVKGFTKEGKECRALPWYGQVRFADRSFFLKGEFAYVGEHAYAEFPDITENLGMGQVVGYSLRNRDAVEIVSPPAGRWTILGKLVTHPGVTPAWVAERINTSLVKVIRHCRVIDTSGNDVPLKSW